MKRFTDDEKIVARNLNKKYNWITRDSDGNLFVYKKKPVKIGQCWNTPDWNGSFFNDLAALNHMFSSVKWEDDEPMLIKNIYDPQILDDVERAYLKSLLKPFYEDVTYVIKYGHIDGDTREKEYLLIQLYDKSLQLNDRTLEFPDFDSGKMYSGMERNKEYTLDELGINYKEAES